MSRSSVLIDAEPNAQVQGRPLGMAEACSGGGVPCNAQLGRWWHVTACAWFPVC
jgi:hypothetical protein